MSIPVALTDLAREAAKYPFAYLLTSRADGRPHGVAVTPTFDGSVMRARGGRTSCANATERSLVALIWPPFDDGGYSLIVDATAQVEGSTLILTATHAVLHRPAASRIV
jgi:hypothetical protein